MVTTAGCRAILSIHDLSDDTDGSAAVQTRPHGGSEDGGLGTGDANSDGRGSSEGSTQASVQPDSSGADANADALRPFATDAQSDANAQPQLAARLTSNLAALDLGIVAVGQVSGGQIQVTNSGAGPTGPLATSLVGSAFFVVSDGCKGTALMPSLSCRIAIGASTAAAGQLTGTVTVADTTADRVAVNVTASVITAGNVVVSPATLDFGGVPLGSTGMAETFTVANTGMAATGRLTTVLGGTSSSEFSMVDGCGGKVLLAGGSCTVTIALAPTTAGPKTASVAVTGTPGGTGTASLTGSGLAPASLSISPTSYAFPLSVVNGGAPSVASFVVTNAGSIATSALTTGLQLGSGTANSEFSIKADTCKGQKLAGMSTCQVAVQFQPATYGSKSATLDISGAATATVTGVGEDFVALSVTKTGGGGGTVSDNSAAIQCGTTCSAQYPRTTANPFVTLTATPDGSSVFTGWSGGGCTGNGVCAVTLAASTAVNAQFSTMTRALTVNFHGLGTQAASVTSSPAGISCSGASCTATGSFDIGKTVVLSVAQAPNAIVAWSNGCTGASCSIRITGTPQTVNVTTTNQNIVFVSSQNHSGNFGGRSGADALCSSLAVAAGIPGRFVSFLGTSTASAFSSLGSARGWIRPDGLPFTDTVSGFQNLVMWYPVSLTELGDSVNEYVFTGVLGMPTCADWTATTGLGNGGTTMNEGFVFTQDLGLNCAQGAHVVCFGTDFSNPVSVTPVPGRRVFASVGAFTPSGGLPFADALCQAEARSAGLANPARFLAVLATTTASAASRFNLNGPTWVRTDGVQVATTPTNFMAGTMTAPPGINPNRAVTWLGSSAGTLGPAASPNENCNDWTTASASVKAEIYDSTLGAPNAFTAYSAFPSMCDASFSVLCLEN